MDAVRLGAVCRALRIKKLLRQEDVAARAGVSRTVVSFLESGRVSRLSVTSLLRVIEALGGRLDFNVRWQGSDLDRLLNARNSALHESVARAFRRLPGWVLVPEVSFSIRGERGVIDIVAWHAATQTLLVIELKTDIVDINELMTTFGRKLRLAPEIAREHGWNPQQVGAWVIVADSVMNRRRVRSHAATLRAALPSDGRTVRGWLRKPSGTLRCLSFWSNVDAANVKSQFATVRRVRRAPPSVKRRPATGP